MGLLSLSDVRRSGYLLKAIDKPIKVIYHEILLDVTTQAKNWRSSVFYYSFRSVTGGKCYTWYRV